VAGGLHNRGFTLTGNSVEVLPGQSTESLPTKSTEMLNKVQLKRELGLFSAVNLNVGCMIGKQHLLEGLTVVSATPDISEEHISSACLLLLLVHCLAYFSDHEDMRRCVPPKCRLTVNRLHGVISQKMAFFLTSTVRTSNPNTCNSKRDRRFGGTYLFNLPPASGGLLLSLLFDPDYGGDMFLRNVGLSPNYKELQSRRPLLLTLILVLSY
jgi:hypothetical protein